MILRSDSELLNLATQITRITRKLRRRSLDWKECWRV